MKIENKLLFGGDGNEIILFVTGEATMSMAPALKKFIWDILDAGHNQLSELRINLKDCHYMDSTFIGTILIVTRKLFDDCGLKCEIVKPSVFCRKTLISMGLIDLLPINDEYEYEGEKFPISMRSLDKLAKSKLLYNAHKELSEVNEENRRMFELVLDCLKKSMDNNH